MGEDGRAREDRADGKDEHQKAEAPDDDALVPFGGG
jgi:hypothetical protein